LLKEPSKEQLYELAKLIADWTIYARDANDEGHGLAGLVSLRTGYYNRKYFQIIWDYLSSQGLVSGIADLDAVFDLRDAIDFRRFSDKWGGGAEARLGLRLLSSSEDLDDDDALCREVTLERETNFCGTNLAVAFDYLQYIPIDIESQYSLAFGASFDLDFDVVLTASAGYLQELNEYLLWDNAFGVNVSLFDTNALELSIASGLEYELSPTASLITELSAKLGLYEGDTSTDHALSVRLQFDLI
jgi:hypothetical protein